MKYKAVIFDFDYTLGDCTEGIAASVNHGLKKLGYEAGELEDIRKTIGLSLKENSQGAGTRRRHSGSVSILKKNLTR